MRRITLAALLCAVLSPANAGATHTAVSLEDVILLAQSGISDETILTFLNSREIDFVLTPEDVARLRDAGVSEEIIRYLLERTGPRAEDAPYYAVPVGSGYAYPPGYYASYYDPWATSYLGVSILPYWLHDYHYRHHPVLLGHGGHDGHGHVVHRSRGHSSLGHLSTGHGTAVYRGSGHGSAGHARSRGSRGHSSRGHSRGGHSRGHSGHSGSHH